MLFSRLLRDFHAIGKRNPSKTPSNSAWRGFCLTPNVGATPRLTRRLFVGAIALGLLGFLLGQFGSPGFYIRWRNIKDGMTQAEVKSALGNPTLTGMSETIGAGNQPVTRWEYRRGRRRYYLDFDYIGSGGAPLAFRTECDTEEWQWPSWLPWAHWKAMG